MIVGPRYAQLCKEGVRNINQVQCNICRSSLLSDLWLTLGKHHLEFAIRPLHLTRKLAVKLGCWNELWKECPDNEPRVALQHLNVKLEKQWNELQSLGTGKL